MRMGSVERVSHCISSAFPCDRTRWLCVRERRVVFMWCMKAVDRGSLGLRWDAARLQVGRGMMR